MIWAPFGNDFGFHLVVIWLLFADNSFDSGGGKFFVARIALRLLSGDTILVARIAMWLLCD